jgi:uracil-DNA glycosylase family 4
MEISRRVLTEHNGSWQARIMFVAEAPGRLGAERTGVPLSGDQSGARFQQLLDAIKWPRSSIFVTNAVLCNPRDAAGRNDAPTPEELSNCAPFLARTIEVVDPAAVIALGRVALDALDRIWPHGVALCEAAGTLIGWKDRWLGVLYHPGARSAVHRPWPRQLADARRLARAIARLGCLTPASGRGARRAPDERIARKR